MCGKPTYAALSVVLALVLAGLACAGATGTPARQNGATATSTLAGQGQTQTGPTQASGAGATPIAVATSAPLSGNLDVKDVTIYVDSDKFFHVVGLVTNGTDKPVNNIQLSLFLTDRDGHSVLPDNTNISRGAEISFTLETELDLLASGESSPFHYGLATNGQDTSGWKSKVEIASSDNPTNLTRVPVVVMHDQMTVSSDGKVYLTGELINQSNKPAQIQRLAGALWSGPDTLVAADIAYYHAFLLAPAGDASGADRTPFVVPLAGPIKAGATPTYYVDGVEGQPSDLQTAATLKLHVDNFYVDAANGVHLVGTVTNSGAQPLVAQLEAGLYDQAGNVVAAGSAYALLPLAPGASVPAAFNDFNSVNGNVDLLRTVVTYTLHIDPWPKATFSNPAVAAAYVALQASNVKMDSSGGGVTLTGEVVNTSTHTLDAATVVVTVNDPSGKLIAANSASVPPATSNGLLPPQGKFVPFSIVIQLPVGLDPATLKFDTTVLGHVHQ